MTMTRIINRQRSLAEQGRLRLGYTTTSTNGKTRPVRSQTWILTSHSREHIETAARLWGGDVEEWQPMGNGAKQWRVITEATTIDAILPPGDPLSQAYEMWNRGGCVRRCDGVTEQLTGSPCQCLAQFGPEWYTRGPREVCTSKSRLKVLLPDMPGLGSWRMETGSYYATDEVAGMVDTIRSAVGDSALVPVRLRIEPRTRVSGGQTKQFVVPVLELRGVTSGALLSGQYTGLAQLAAANAHEAPALEQGQPDWHGMADQCESIDEVRDVWHQAKDAGALTAELSSQLQEVSQRFAQPEPNHDDTEPEPDREQTWQAIISTAGDRGMTTDVLMADLETFTGGIALPDCSGFQLAGYLAHLQEVSA